MSALELTPAPEEVLELTALGSPEPDGEEQTCPHCEAPAAPGALFCETCGYDFTTGSLPDLTDPPELLDPHGTTPIAPPPPKPVLQAADTHDLDSGGAAARVQAALAAAEEAVAVEEGAAAEAVAAEEGAAVTKAAKDAAEADASLDVDGGLDADGGVEVRPGVETPDVDLDLEANAADPDHAPGTDNAELFGGDGELERGRVVGPDGRVGPGTEVETVTEAEPGTEVETSTEGPAAEPQTPPQAGTARGENHLSLVPPLPSATEEASATGEVEPSRTEGRVAPLTPPVPLPPAGGTHGPSATKAASTSFTISSAPVGEAKHGARNEEGEPGDPPLTSPSGTLMAVPEAAVPPAEEDPGKMPAEPWVVEIWVDPDWYAMQDAQDIIPSAGLPGVVALKQRSILVGRPSRTRSIHPQVDCSPDSGVSRRHCQLTTDGQRWWVEDLDSSNGTYIADPGDPLPHEPIPGGEKRELSDGARVYIGAWTRLVIRRAAPGEV